MEGAKRAKSLDIDNPLYDYTDNCNRYKHDTSDQRFLTFWLPRPEKVVNIEKEKGKEKSEEDDVYVYQAYFVHMY